MLLRACRENSSHVAAKLTAILEEGDEADDQLAPLVGPLSELPAGDRAPDKPAFDAATLKHPRTSVIMRQARLARGLGSGVGTLLL